MKGSKKPTQSGELTAPGVDLGQLERLLSFMSEHGLEEFEYAHGDLRIRLKKAAASSTPSRPLLATSETSAPATSPRTEAPRAPSAAVVAEPAATPAPAAPV